MLRGVQILPPRHSGLLCYGTVSLWGDFIPVQLISNVDFPQYCRHLLNIKAKLVLHITNTSLEQYWYLGTYAVFPL